MKKKETKIVKCLKLIFVIIFQRKKKSTLSPSQKQHLGHINILVSKALSGEVWSIAKRSTLYLGIHGSKERNNLWDN
jgi:hypothetical protein